MNMQTAGDIPMIVKSENSGSERRITPSWSIGQLKSKLVPVTGIPSSDQKLTLWINNQQSIDIQALDEENTQLTNFPLAPHAVIHSTHLADIALRGILTPFPPKNEKLGRFNPDAPSLLDAKLAVYDNEIKEKGISVGKRCRVGEDDSRRGEVMYVGDVEEIPGGAGKWIGIKLDEPVGKNDGSLGGKRYWGKDGDGKFGVFVRPERVTVGDFPVLDDLEDMEEM
ncbi:hypothetical protein SS1G_01861 [Sclerotinia sclerotiorum 1980 UF-70]|uniref:CAP-Gly domain-containing protein n=1 Tax=Sclerotinia sclerotiorum (strain ATCC 18683 / 1980 / Ss-1) TaxID=665079 RepID=A7E981_SCLS1|nr:hypothetical protein SS1G_01861 [Sclerotinia sclerotiorum 1980 UF-70]EDN96933.1 hypothetical protein SS1G_01861 [Sclerotinia sclerotiorum 1980 UF-70]